MTNQSHNTSLVNDINAALFRTSTSAGDMLDSVEIVLNAIDQVQFKGKYPMGRPIITALVKNAVTTAFFWREVLENTQNRANSDVRDEGVENEALAQLLNSTGAETMSEKVQNHEASYQHALDVAKALFHWAPVTLRNEKYMIPNEIKRQLSRTTQAKEEAVSFMRRHRNYTEEQALKELEAREESKAAALKPSLEATAVDIITKDKLSGYLTQEDLIRMLRTIYLELTREPTEAQLAQCYDENGKQIKKPWRGAIGQLKYEDTRATYRPREVECDIAILESIAKEIDSALHSLDLEADVPEAKADEVIKQAHESTQPGLY